MLAIRYTNRCDYIMLRFLNALLIATDSSTKHHGACNPMLCPIDASGSQASEVVQLGRPIVKPAPHHIEELKEYEAQLA